nr:hypothetical protein [Tanacetum cinerariifolium]
MAPLLEWWAVRFLVTFSTALAAMYGGRENGTTTRVSLNIEAAKCLVERKRTHPFSPQHSLASGRDNELSHPTNC